MAALAVTKFFDVLTTMRRLRHAHDETNPIVRRLMFRIGPTTTIWLVFAVAIAIIGAAGWAASDASAPLQIVFIVLGVAISLIQAGVALSNHTGRDNIISRMVRNVYVRR
jgi:hypothetical protein